MLHNIAYAGKPDCTCLNVPLANHTQTHTGCNERCILIYHVLSNSSDNYQRNNPIKNFLNKLLLTPWQHWRIIIFCIWGTLSLCICLQHIINTWRTQNIDKMYRQSRCLIARGQVGPVLLRGHLASMCQGFYDQPIHLLSLIIAKRSAKACAVFFN